MKVFTSRTSLLALTSGVALLLSACGGSNTSSGGPPATTTASSTGSATDTVSMQTIGGVSTLVDANGDALYSPDQEKGGTILCTDGCTAVWVPLTLSAAMGKPTAATALAGKLGIVRRPDGKRQVTWNRKPLYTFAEDGGPGKVSGNGASDRFDGKSFTWHVATAGKGAPAPTTTQMSGGSGY
jgi:predicted lipoprotein with Yx(FWY)xxD motif